MNKKAGYDHRGIIDALCLNFNGCCFIKEKAPYNSPGTSRSASQQRCAPWFLFSSPKGGTLGETFRIGFCFPPFFNLFCPRKRAFLPCFRFFKTVERGTPVNYFRGRFALARLPRRENGGGSFPRRSAGRRFFPAQFTAVEIQFRTGILNFFLRFFILSPYFCFLWKAKKLSEEEFP